MPERYEYKVVEVRERMIGGKMSGDKLEQLLNDHASQGWQLKAITSADVKGRIGPGVPRASLSPSNAVLDRYAANVPGAGDSLLPSRRGRRSWRLAA